MKFCNDCGELFETVESSYECYCTLSPFDQIEVLESEARKELLNIMKRYEIEIMRRTEPYKKIIEFECGLFLKQIRKKKEKFFFITVNPFEDVKIDEFKNKVERFMRRPFLVNPQYVYEQTGTTEQDMGKHPHVHIICDKLAGITKSKMVRFAHETFNKIVGNASSIDVKEYTYDFYDDKIKYITGQKWDEGKEDACKINIIWREKFGLENTLKDIKI